MILTNFFKRHFISRRLQQAFIEDALVLPGPAAQQGADRKVGQDVRRSGAGPGRGAGGEHGHAGHRAGGHHHRAVAGRQRGEGEEGAAGGGGEGAAGEDRGAGEQGAGAGIRLLQARHAVQGAGEDRAVHEGLQRSFEQGEKP